MRLPFCSRSALLSLLISVCLPATVLADDVLETAGFSNCVGNATISISRMVIKFDRSTNSVTFDVAGENTKIQNVSASLAVTAYGRDVYSRTLNPCDKDTYISEICPVPIGTFSASGTYTIPSEYSSLIPAIAYNVPNLDADVKLTLTSLDDGSEAACVDTSVSNGKSAAVPAAQYAAVGVAGAALVMSGISAIAGIGSVSSIGAVGMGHVGAAHMSPTFVEVVGWFHSMAMNGLLSVPYPSIYRSFTQNFGFSLGIVSWDTMQITIDQFRASTGGNLTDNSVPYLRNSTIVWQSDLLSIPAHRRSVDSFPLLLARQIVTSVNGTSTTIGSDSSNTSIATNSTGSSQTLNYVSNIRGYVEELSVPNGNVFMTLLLFFAVVLAAIAAGILLLKVILEGWALFSHFPTRLANFRQHYWWIMAKTMVTLILLLYGVWTLWTVYQFKNGDSWAAKLLAGLTLGVFTAILLGFTWQISRKARDITMLYEDKKTWERYSLFYENYKQKYWWIFVPSIVYMFSKGCVIAAADGHGLVQTAGQLIIESIMLILLLWSRPFALKSGNWINIIIQVIRVVSIICILIFVEALGFSQTTKTVTGWVLVIVQSVLTAVLAILILINAIVTCVRANPNHRRRKEADKLRNQDELTPLDAHNSMLMYPIDKKEYVPKPDHAVQAKVHTRVRSKNGYDMLDDEEARHNLPRFAATIGGRVVPTRYHSHDDYPSDLDTRQPQLPDLDYRGRGV